MNHYIILGNRFKGDFVKFIRKISKDFTKPIQKFVADMTYGMIASNSCKLTEIGRALKENIELKKTAERLGRNLAGFSQKEELMKNYLPAVTHRLGKETMLLIDESDVIKPCSPDMEAIGTVYDASEGKFGRGYWTMGVAALTDNKQQPVPVYEKLYPCKKQGGLGSSAETKNALQFLRENFDNSIPRIFDRGFDSQNTIMDMAGNDEKFILRANQNRTVVHNGRKTYIDDVVRGLVCGCEMTYRSKLGKNTKCQIGMTQVVLPRMKNLKLNLVVCKGYGKPLVLYTNLGETEETIALRVVKAYLMRWRIEEFYAFKKQRFHFEDFRVRSLAAIQTLDLLLTVAIGYLGLFCSEVDADSDVIALIQMSKRTQKIFDYIKTTKIYYHAILDGLTFLFALLSVGISGLFAKKPVPNQLSLSFV